MEKYVLELIKIGRYTLASLNIDKGIIRTDNLHSPPHLYSNDFDALRDVADSLQNEEHYLRQTNLEDLFMKLTGRKLNADQ